METFTPFSEPVFAVKIDPLDTLKTALDRSGVCESHIQCFLAGCKNKDMAVVFSEMFVESDGDEGDSSQIVCGGSKLLRRMRLVITESGYPSWEFPDRSVFFWSGSKTAARIGNKVFC